MFDRDAILKSLNSENYYIDRHSLDLFLQDWKIDSIYEDESGLEFYDDLSVEKIKKGISLKAQSFSDDQIVAKLQKMEAKVSKEDTEATPPTLVSDVPTVVDCNQNESDENTVTDLTPSIQSNKSFTLDVSSQTLQMLAEAVAKKISDDITNSEMATKLIEAGGYKRDNEILAKQVKELLDHNKELSSRIEILESQASRSLWSKIWGQK